MWNVAAFELTLVENNSKICEVNLGIVILIVADRKTEYDV